MVVQVKVDDTKAPRRKLLVLERFGAAVTSVALEVVLAMVRAGWDDARGCRCRRCCVDRCRRCRCCRGGGAALIVLAGAPAPPIVAGVSPLGRVVFIIANL